MPDLPDFDLVFERLALVTGAFQAPLDDIRADLAEQLRLIWNARGAADLTTVKRELLGTCRDFSHSDPDNSGQCITCGVVLDYMEHSERAEQLDRALRTLDR